MSVLVKGAGFKGGYSGDDHLLDDEPLRDMIGRTYRDARAAKRAANAIAKRQGYPGSSVPIWLKLSVDGEDVQVTA